MSLTALDDDGKPVDWWFAYKVPKLTRDASTPPHPASRIPHSGSSQGGPGIHADSPPAGC